MTFTSGPCPQTRWPSAVTWSLVNARSAPRSMWCEISSHAFVRSSRSATPPSRWKAAIRAVRFTMERASTTTRMRPLSLSALGQKCILALQDPPRDGDSRRIGGVHSPIAESARAERPGLGVRSVGCVVDDSQVEIDLGHVHAFAQRVTIRLNDLVASVEIRPGLHLDDRVASVVIGVEVVAVL